jgi:hypothetical protein
LKFAAGAKRSAVVADNSKALLLEAPVEILLQFVPSVDHCHVPWAAVAASPVMAIPASAFADEPPDTWSAVSEKLAPTSEDTVSPVALGVSSKIVVVDIDVGATTTGASFTAFTVILNEFVT